ncbi:MAG: 50S ribosomal protein L29 [Pirellulales bacterium]|nr:50S ribosomal protein L29 [Pirellulales bacterium]
MEKAHHLREMSDEQLAMTLKDATKTLFKLLIQSQTERLDAPSELKKHRRFIARIKTIQRERELKTENQAAQAAETLSP